MTALASRSIDVGWLHRLQESVPAYMEQLRLGDQVGRYVPCRQGATDVGREMALGWSCFALKIHHMLGLWSALPEEERAAWIGFLQSFQKNDGEGAFVDPPEIAYLEAHVPFRERLRRVFRRGQPTHSASAIALAETKQAIATLAEVGAAPRRPFKGFPHTRTAVREWLEKQDWTRPWGAGGQSAGLVVFIKTQAPQLLPEETVQELLEECRDFYASLVDFETGAYFRGTRPAHGEMINGAMKVLMALEWLEVVPHHAERLINTCVQRTPSSRGCHLVDAVYVVHQCLAGKPPGDAARAFCAQIFDGMKHHAQDDGGFSFQRDRAQTKYYGVPVSRGLPESDIQGTCLLIWALAMIWRMLDPGTAAWKTMRP